MQTQQTIKAGTRIEFPILYPGYEDKPEHAVIGRWTAINGCQRNHINGNPGQHLVKFADGGALIVHQDRFRVIDNR